MKQIYKYAIYMVAIMLLSSCYPIRRVGLLQEREGLPEYEKGEYEQYHLQKNDELELRVISMNPETALLFQQRASSYLSTSSSSFTYRIYEDGTIDANGGDTTSSTPVSEEEMQSDNVDTAPLTGTLLNPENTVIQTDGITTQDGE